MGVVYKLKKEVIDFIVSQKQADPDISCRKLSETIQEKFQIKVSKSSVNAVIKQAQLSSPIGRRASAQEKSQAFQIPKEKKIELTQSFSQEAGPLLENQAPGEPVAEAESKPAVTDNAEPSQPLPIEESPNENKAEITEEPPAFVEPSKDSPAQEPEEAVQELSSEGQEESQTPAPTEEVQSSKPEETVSAEETAQVVQQELPVLPSEPAPVDAETQEAPPPSSEEPARQEDVQTPSEEALILPQETPSIDENKQVTEAESKKQEEPPAPAIPQESDESHPETKADDAGAHKEEPPAFILADEKNDAKPLLEEPVAPDEEERPHLRLDPLATPSEPEPQEESSKPVEKIPEPAEEPPQPVPEPPKSVEEPPVSGTVVPEESAKPAESAETPFEKEAAVPVEPVQDSSPPAEKPLNKEYKTESLKDTDLPDKTASEKKEPEDATPQPQPLSQSPSSKRYVDDKIWTPGSQVFHDTEASKLKTQPVQSPLYDNMGCFFLKGAEWELSSSSILGGILNRYVKDYMATDINLAAETILYLTAFGIGGLKDFESYHQEGLWALNNIAEKPNLGVLSKLIEGVHDLKSFSLSMSNEYSQLFSETNYIKLNFHDGADVCFDAQFKSIWYENNVQTVFSIPLNKSFGYLSSNLISNVQPVIIFGIPGYKNFSKQFYDMMLAFNGNFPDKNIVKIGIFDNGKSEIAKFASVPIKRRYFIAGIWPWQEECKRFIEEDLKVIKEFRHDALGKEIYYSELRTKLDQQMIGQVFHVRVGLLRDTGLGWPTMGVMTNMDEKIPMEDILSMYLARWPNGQEGHNDFSAKTEKATYGAISIAPPHDKVSLLEGAGTYNLLGSTPDFWTNVKFLLSAVNGYCQRHFFPPHYEKLDFPSVKERFYGLPGHIEKTGKTLAVTLVIPPGYGYLKDLEYSVARFNESDIRDPQGMKVFLKWRE